MARMNNRVIGRIVTISHNNIIAELSIDVGNYVSIYDGIRFVGEIGSYVAIDDINRRIIAEIIAVDEKNEMVSERMNKAGSRRYLRISLIGEIANNTFVFGVTKMPPIFSEIKIISESDLQLMLDITESEEEAEHGETKLKVLPIGTSVMFPDYDVKVKLNEFFGFHFAVFGNTGSGKSNTIARMIQTIFSKTNLPARGAKFIVFDSNGEYKSAFENIGVQNADIKVKFLNTSGDGNEKIEIPVWALSVDDWAILLHASEKTQVPIIGRALEFIRLFDVEDNSDEAKRIKNHVIATVIKDILSSSENQTGQSGKILFALSKFNTDDFSLDKAINTNIEDTDFNKGKIIPQTISIAKAISTDYGKMFTPFGLIEYCNSHIISDFRDLIKDKRVIPYSLQRFVEAVEFAVLYEGSINSARIYEYTSTLVTRLKHLTESEQGSFFAKTDFATIEDYIKSIIGDNQLLNIDISSLDDTATEVITKVFSKMLFDYIRSLSPRNSMPINLILEEAHRFVRTDMDYGVLGYNIFERIAKEGRKYGLLMGISSQRPSELSKTVVSQCSNFIIHKIQNPDDIQYISRMVPYVNQGIIDRITYLRRGYALVFGTAINLPTLTMFEKAVPTPNSGNSNITEKWYIRGK
ncbi:MAG: ATP-binding protein [Prevotella sp.]|jgi:DNA helicase HerA-like ATPase|nr:ATP-binding protein [Prevotella sp.]